MVMFKSDSKLSHGNLADNLFVPCHAFGQELFAVTSNFLSDAGDSEDSDHGCIVFFSRRAAGRLLNEHKKVYGTTPRWVPRIATLSEYLARTGDSAAACSQLAELTVSR